VAHSYTANMKFPKTSTSRTFTLTFAAAALFFVGTGCSSKTIQYPEDHERYLRIDQAVELLRHSYERKNASKMADLMLPTEQIDRLQRDVDNDFESFYSITLEFSIERIMIEGDDIDVYVHWQGVWKRDADDPGFRQRGHSRLQWVGTKVVLLRGIQGDAPFGAKARQALASPPETPSVKK
jgi:hypothetical protein